MRKDIKLRLWILIQFIVYTHLLGAYIAWDNYWLVKIVKKIPNDISTRSLFAFAVGVLVYFMLTTIELVKIHRKSKNHESEN